MNKYQEYQKALEMAYETMNELDFSTAKKGCKYLKILEGLVDQTKLPTEDAVLKEFEKLGWKHTKKPNNKILFEKYNQDYALNDFILINMNLKIYSGTFIDLKTHQLLTKLFESLEETKDEI